jgi:hypothetical protein
VRRGGSGVSLLTSPEGAWGRSQGISVPPAVLVDLHPKALRHARHSTFAQQPCRPGRVRQRRHRCRRASRLTGGPGGSHKPSRDRHSWCTSWRVRRPAVFIAGNQATRRKGSVSCMSKRLVALAAMKSCNADEISASVSAARRANASAASEVASRDHPSTGLKETIRTGKAYWPDRRFCRIVSSCQLHPFRARRNRRARRSLQAPDRCRGRVGQLTQSRARLRYTGRRERPGCRGHGGRPGPLRRLG